MSTIDQFELGVSEVRLLLGLTSEHVEEDLPTVEQNNAVYRASVVLLVSHFESFLKAIAEDFVDLLDSGTLESRQIPNGLRELHTIPRLNEIVESNDAAQRATLLRKLTPLMALWNDSAKPPPGTLKSATLSREVTNAYGLTIDRLFVLMGSKGNVCDGDIDVPDADGETLPVNIRLSLTDVVKCRNDISHGDLSRRPTVSDVNRYIAFLSAMSKRLDRKAEALRRTVQPEVELVAECAPT
ncbi:HEPN domain-containing protein [Terracoccus luteus]|uniref:HEPN domain-containing protein n=1 Tax=Terracoccus luteus TaxID=53356 RepID=UPI0011C3A48C|nr:MAE_28990/MAE_18760 family HEPN-like nuclease [Terracoccus luteus]